MTDVGAGRSAHEAMKEQLREQIVKLYLESPDFNGVEAASLMAVAEEFSVDPEIVLTGLVEEGAIYANFGHEMVNPDILGFPPQQRTT